MINYKISIKKLKQIANPFEHIFLTDKMPLVVKDIDHAINSGKIFPEDNLSEKERIVRAIAYEILNKDKKENVILDFSQLNNETSWVVTSGVIELAAAIYNKEEEIIAGVIGEDKVIKSFLGKITPFNSDPNLNVNFIQKEDLFDWSIDTEILNESWNNEDFVLKKIESLRGERVAELKDFIDPALWKNKDYLLKCLHINNDILNILPYDILLGENMWEIILNEDNLSTIFDYIWDCDLKNILKDDNYIENLNKNLKEGSIYITKEKIEENILKNPAFIEKTIKNESLDFLKYIDDEMKSNPNIIDKIFLIHNKKSQNQEQLENYLPKFFFNNVQNTLRLIESRHYQRNSLEKEKKLYEAWINNKKDVIYFIQNFVEKSQLFIVNFYDFLPKEMKKDKDIVIELMKRNSNIYDEINMVLKNDTDIIELFIMDNEQLYCAEEKIKKIIFNIKDENTIKTIIKNNSELLNEKGCPREWRNNVDLITLNENYFRSHIEKFPKTVIEKLFIENAELGKKILRGSSSYFYSKLPLSVREMPEIALVYLEKNDIDSISDKLWLNKDFCIKALDINFLVLKKIPFHFLKEKTMVLNIAEKLDKGIIDLNNLKNAPKEIKMFFEAFDITPGDYVKFMTNYFFKEKMKKELNETTAKKINKMKV